MRGGCLGNCDIGVPGRRLGLRPVCDKTAQINIVKAHSHPPDHPQFSRLIDYLGGEHGKVSDDDGPRPGDFLLQLADVFIQIDLDNHLIFLT